MAPRNDPSALRWLIGTEIARFRKDSGQSLAALSKATGITKPKLSYMETGKFQQHPDDIATVLAACGASERDIDRLGSLAARADGKAWWAPWSSVVPDWNRTYVGLEGLAESAFMFEPLMIPGILQTPGYAEAVTRATNFVRPDFAERFVSFRRARTERVTTDDDPLRLQAVIGESALRLRVGTDEVRRNQLIHLLVLAEKHGVGVQILRAEDGPHPAIEIGSFVVLEFDEAQPVAYSALFDGAVYVQDSTSVQTYTMVADDLRATAQSPAESIDTIKKALIAL